MKWLNLFILTCLLFSCKKEKLELELIDIPLSVEDNLYDINFVNSNVAYICGGKLWETGVILKSIDGGNTWLTQLETDNVLYALSFKNENEGIAVGFSGRVWRTVDGGINWVLKENDPNYPVFTDAVFLDNDKVVLSAGYSYHYGGFASYNFTSLNFTDSSSNTDMQGLYFFNQQEGLTCGYGSIYKTSNGGETWQVTNANGDYFKDMAFNNQEGLAIGYQGRILKSNTNGATWEKSTKKGSFFTTKGNLESVSVNGNEAFIVGQNATLLYSQDFTSDEWVSVENDYKKDFLAIELLAGNVGFVAGSNGLLFKFIY